MKKFYDEFNRLPVGKMAEKISDITYEYKQTEVPKQHYKTILETELVEFMASDSTMECVLLTAIINQLQSLEKESPRLFFKALLCMNKNIKIEKINSRIYEALEETYQTYKTAKIIDEEILQEYDYFYEIHAEKNEQQNTDFEETLIIIKS